MSAPALPQPPTCACEATAVRIRLRANGARAYVLQCLDCGREVRAVKKDGAEVRALAEYPSAFDDTLRERWRTTYSAYWEQRRQAQVDEREQESIAWWQRYNAYLKTPRWIAKRTMVLDRAGGLCEGCRRLKATQVHHLTYDHVGNELLFELVAVCDACHRVLHPDMDDR
jgi:hypothetical protein